MFTVTVLKNRVECVCVCTMVGGAGWWCGKDQAKSRVIVCECCAKQKTRVANRKPNENRCCCCILLLLVIPFVHHHFAPVLKHFASYNRYISI